MSSVCARLPISRMRERTLDMGDRMTGLNCESVAWACTRVFGTKLNYIVVVYKAVDIQRTRECQWSGACCVFMWPFFPSLSLSFFLSFLLLTGLKYCRCPVALLLLLFFSSPTRMVYYGVYYVALAVARSLYNYHSMYLMGRKSIISLTRKIQQEH